MFERYSFYFTVEQHGRKGKHLNSQHYVLSDERTCCFVLAFALEILGFTLSRSGWEM